MVSLGDDPRNSGSALSGFALAGLVAFGGGFLGVATAHAQVQVVGQPVETGLSTQEADLNIVQVVEGLEHGWAVDWLPDGSKLISERPGNLYLIDGETVYELSNLPEIETDASQRTAPEGGAQGGLLDVAVHPDYEDNGWIYFTYSSPGDTDTVFTDDPYGTGTALARARICTDEERLTDRETLYAQVPRYESGRHYGSRIVFLGDGTLLFSIGDRGLRHPSQDLSDPGGSMIRLTDDGDVPEDNPFLERELGQALPEIYSFGHRNNQGMAKHPQSGRVWTTEHGPSGGDLLHVLEAGANYGWPQVSFGTEYSTGEKIGIGKSAPGVNEPIMYWEDSFAPSGLTFYHQGHVDQWEGDLFAGSLVRSELWRLRVDKQTEEVIHDEIVLSGEVGRIRDVAQGPDGYLYVITDEGDSGLYRLEPQD
ncbi:PQQ-dependent sugar dehydrogenase [Halorhodospira halochloris]|uniref:PQQ-dependent sugar dehydrogenase n=1 Tax=Halorhodospira halochloris TaxID=1052 RepID=UPI001EE86B74|nr:PQQ-dependent sugar dehydrogenase [Halorhodospira halochloris]MCG5548550.1 PQQ-dependent sugar dehydrogenase [Halorhodospira halochloris]